MSTNPINGGVKFFEQSKALFKNGTTATASSNEDSVKFILDVNKYTQWESVGSNDITTETITVTMSSAKLINRILLVDFNFKEFEVKYWNGASFVSFTNVVSVNGESKIGISETDYSFDTGYYQFDDVTTDIIQITCLKTQINNDQKQIVGFVATEEIGTLQGFPRVNSESSRNEAKAKSLSKKMVIQKSYDTEIIKMNFKTHPYQNDLDILEDLYDREESVLVYPCGARSGTKYFKHEQKSWRLKDIFNMKMTGKFKNDKEKGVYLLGFNKSVTFEEHV